MANVLVDENSLTSIANAIRTKNGTQTTYLPSAMPQAILDIQPTVSLQNKTVTPTTSQQVIQADSGYDGLDEVTVNAVTNAIDSNITAGNIKKDVSILGVTGTYEGSGGEYNTHLITNITERISGVSSITLFIDKLPSLNTSGLTLFDYFFYNFKRLTTIPTIDTSSATNMAHMFDGCTILTTIPTLNTANVTSALYMFNNCKAITTIPALDFSKVTNSQYMFFGCDSLTTLPALDFSKVTNSIYMFANCQNLTTITSLTTSTSLTNAGSMFSGCNKLTAIPSLDISNVTAMSYMFNNCKAITTIPSLDTSKATNMSYMFSGCSALTTLPQLSAAKATNMQNMFSGCSALTDTSLNNILSMCIGATSYKSSKTLKQLGFTSSTISASRIRSLSNYSTFTSAGWSIGYS